MPGSIIPPGRALDFLGIVQRNPAVSLISIGLQKPPFRCARSISFLYNGKAPFSRVARTAVARARAFSDIEIADGNLNHERAAGSICATLTDRSRLFAGIHGIAIFIKHAVAWISIRTLLCVGQNLVGALLGFGVCPGLADTVKFRFSVFLCRGLCGYSDH